MEDNLNQPAKPFTVTFPSSLFEVNSKIEKNGCRLIILNAVWMRMPIDVLLSILREVPCYRNELPG
jgi:hypothetical protein